MRNGVNKVKVANVVLTFIMFKEWTTVLFPKKGKKLAWDPAYKN